MNYKQLSKQIKSGEFEQIYFLHGEEEYVKDRLYEQLYEKLAPTVMPEFNVNFLRAATDEAIIAACMTPPMMAEEKLVVVRDCALFGGDEETKTSSSELRAAMDRLTGYLDSLPKNVRLIFWQRGKAPGNNRLKKYLSSHAAEVLVDFLKENEAQDWIVARMRRAGFSMDAEAANMLYYFVGPAMGEVAGELDKMALYAQPGARIDASMVRHITQDRSSVRIFAFTDHLGMGRMQKAFDSLEGVRRGDADAFQILYMTARQYRMIARGCQMAAAKMPAAEIKKELGVADFVYRSLENQMRATGLSRALSALDILLDAEEGLKTGRYRDEDLVLDAALAQIAALYAG